MHMNYVEGMVTRVKMYEDDEHDMFTKSLLRQSRH